MPKTPTTLPTPVANFGNSKLLLVKIHEKTISGRPDKVLAALKTNEKTEKGEYCVVLDLHQIKKQERTGIPGELPVEARLILEMKSGKNLREAQEALIEYGTKKNSVKQAAILLKKLFNEN